MNKLSPATLLTVGATLITIGATFGIGRSHAATRPDASSAAMARYQQDRANCMAGKTYEDRKTCLREAAAALQAARSHDLTGGDAQLYAANERKRCDPLTGDDKKACLMRVAGQGTTSGSVAGGGELHTLVQEIPGAVPEPESLPPTAAGPSQAPPAQPQQPPAPLPAPTPPQPAGN
jgi:hypothetical protein